MAREGFPRRINEPGPHREPRYPGAPLDHDAAEKARLDAERCHIFPPKTGVRVMTQGVFDILHLGHLHYFEAARALGDELVVVLARDETVARNKHAPVFSQEARREMVEGLKPVDMACVGHKGDFYRIVEEIDPDIICIGYDQPYKEAAIEEECTRRGMTVKVVRLQHMDYDLDSTRKVVEAIGKRLADKELYRTRDVAGQRRLDEAEVTEKEVKVDPEEGQPRDEEAERATPSAEDKVNQPQRATPKEKSA